VFFVAYLTPELIANNPDMLNSLYQQGKISLFAVDEAHCVSGKLKILYSGDSKPRGRQIQHFMEDITFLEWGHEFRPEYRRLSLLRTSFPKIPLMALTATATPRVQQDIRNNLLLNNPVTTTCSLNRANLWYGVTLKSDSILTDLNSILKPADNTSENRKFKRFIVHFVTLVAIFPVIIYCLTIKDCEAVFDVITTSYSNLRSCTSNAFVVLSNDL
jgi:superfamily II DNA helicase RecQ